LTQPHPSLGVRDVARLGELGAVALPGTPEEYQARNVAQHARLGELIRRVGIKAD